MSRMLIKPNQSKKIFELLKEGYEINMQKLEDINKKENYVIFYYKTDEYGKKIYNEEEENNVQSQNT